MPGQEVNIIAKKIIAQITNLKGEYRIFELFLPDCRYFRVLWEYDRDGEPINVRVVDVAPEKEKEMSKESLDHVIAGALYSFAAFLTAREKPIVCSAMDGVAPVVEVLTEFMGHYGIDASNPMIEDWPTRLANGRCAPLPSAELKPGRPAAFTGAEEGEEGD